MASTTVTKFAKMSDNKGKSWIWPPGKTLVVISGVYITFLFPEKVRCGYSVAKAARINPVFLKQDQILCQQ
jgi:hypothetical protein